jgi:toxin HigB-1
MLDMIIESRYPRAGLIKTFADLETRTFWETGKSRKVPPPNLRATAKRKLAMLDAAKSLDDLKTPPNNRLHRLHHDRAGRHAIRINDQFRLCFRWQDGNAFDVTITDYH